MAAVTRAREVRVRAAQPGEGRGVAALWRELWDVHEGWGGYAGSHDVRVYDQLAARLDQDAIVRAGQPVLGRHVHLVAELDGEVCGQVEGWFERHGVDPSTPHTCEVRSLVVAARARGSGAGRALLDELARTALEMARGSSVVLVAEVLEPNPALTFYDRVGYVPVSWSARIDVRDARAARAHDALASAAGYTARIGEPKDALPIALLEATLAARRRASGDVRFDRPRAVDATFVGAIAAHLAHGLAGGPSDPQELVVVDGGGAVCGAASFAVNALEPPFLPVRRAMVGRFALDAARDPALMVLPLVAFGCRLAAQRGAPSVELTDLTAPGSPLNDAAIAAGGRAWSRVVARLLHLPSPSSGRISPRTVF
jgi:GNAT superfamily N-acetyltransferase